MGVSKGEDPGSPVSLAGQAQSASCSLRPCRGRARPPQQTRLARVGVSRARPGIWALGGRGFREGGLSSSHFREKATRPRKLWTTGHPLFQRCPQSRELRSLCGYLRRTPFLPDTLPAALTAKALGGVHRPVRGGEAALLGSPACHICTYLKLGWWSSLSGMPIVGLAAYDICTD